MDERLPNPAEQHSPLSQKARFTLGRLAQDIRNNPTPYLIAAGIVATHAAVGGVLHPDHGALTYAFPTKAILPVSGQDALNFLAAATEFASMVGGIPAVALKAGREYISQQAYFEGKEKNRNRGMVLAVDLTNEPDGSYQGDFIKELYLLLEAKPEIDTAIRKAFGGPICELVSDKDVPTAGSIPQEQYFKAPNGAINESKWLEDTVEAYKASKAFLAVALNKSHTVFDPDEKSIATISAAKNVLADTAASIARISRKHNKTKKGSEEHILRKLVITNDQDIVTHGAIEDVAHEEKLAHQTSEIPLATFFERRGFEKPINAEETVMESLISRFLTKDKFHQNILLADDGTPEGARIANNFLKYYEKNKENYAAKFSKDKSQLPNIVGLPEYSGPQGGKKLSAEEIFDSRVKSTPHDAILVLGGKDENVAGSVAEILTKQFTEGGYETKPIEVLMEGRSNLETIEDRMNELVTENNTKSNGTKNHTITVHLVHKMLAEKFVSELLKVDLSTVVTPNIEITDQPQVL